MSQSLPHPIRRLPSEILGQEIFTRCIAEPFFISGKNAPLVLSSICQHWRELALSTPALWSRISVNIHEEDSVYPVGSPRTSEPGDQYGIVPNLETILLWLNRSGHHPLYLSLCDSTSSEDDEDGAEAEETDGVESSRLAACDRVLSLFAVHVNRWHALKLEMAFRAFPVAMHSIPEGGAPALATLHIEMGEPDEPDEFEDALPADYAHIIASVSRLLAPSQGLHSLTWLPRFQILQALPVQWSHLVEIDLMSRVSVTDLISMLHSCRDIESLRMTGGISADPGTTAVNQLGAVGAAIHITLSRLRELHLYTITDLEGLFDVVTLPALQSLYLSYDDTAASRPKSPTLALASFIARSGCSLLSLALMFFDVSEDDLLPLLQIVSPSLTHLRLANRDAICIKDRLLAKLTPKCPVVDTDIENLDSVKSSSPRITYPFPMLKSIQWGDRTNIIDASPGLLSDMIASRQPKTLLSIPASCRPVHLETAYFDFGGMRERYLEDCSRLEVMRTDGLDFRIQGRLGGW